MQEFLNRPYRNRKVREQRKVSAVAYCKKLTALKIQKAEVPSNSIFVPPKLVEIVEALDAGVQPSNTEGADSGATPKK